MQLPSPFGKYLLTELISSGGMANVYKAKAFGFGGFEKIVAIKIIHKHLIIDEEFLKMFIDEGKIASYLNHPNIVQIFDLGKIDNNYYISMEFVDGIDLGGLNRLVWEKGLGYNHFVSAYIIREVANALHYAHTKSGEDGKSLEIVHRDISPHNILVSRDGIVKLADFGVAKARLRLSKTHAGFIKGKYPYMSPEQVGGTDLDHRSDIFSLCGVFYEMVTGRPAFAGNTEYEIMENVIKCIIGSASLLKSSIPAEIEKIILQGLKKNPASRYASAEELRKTLTEFLIKKDGGDPQTELKKMFDDESESVTKKTVEKSTEPHTVMINHSPSLKFFVRLGMVFMLMASMASGWFIYKFFIKDKPTSMDSEITSAIPQKINKNNEKMPEEKITGSGSLNINSSPWAYVYIDGKKIGETPLLNIKVEEGGHSLFFENPLAELKHEEIITVKPGKNAYIFKNLAD
ncbi:MAG TPA: protein kinase [bacterium]